VAAARSLVLTQQPDVLKRLLALALGAERRPEVGGVPVGSVLSMLSTLFGQAAEDAETIWDDGSFAEEDLAPYLYGSPPSAAQRAEDTYAQLMEAEDDRVATSLGWEVGR